VTNDLRRNDVRERRFVHKTTELENNRLRKAVSDLALDKVILQEAARGDF
jgi:hypothetical protein